MTFFEKEDPSFFGIVFEIKTVDYIVLTVWKFTKKCALVQNWTEKHWSK